MQKCGQLQAELDVPYPDLVELLLKQVWQVCNSAQDLLRFFLVELLPQVLCHCQSPLVEPLQRVVYCVSEPEWIHRGLLLCE